MIGAAGLGLGFSGLRRIPNEVEGIGVHGKREKPCSIQGRRFAKLRNLPASSMPHSVEKIKTWLLFIHLSGKPKSGSVIGIGLNELYDYVGFQTKVAQIIRVAGLRLRVELDLGL